MNLIKIYVELKLFGGAVFLLGIMIYLVYLLISTINIKRKDKLLKKNGFNYIEGLPGAPKQFRSKYEKDGKWIMAANAYDYSFKQLKEWVKK